MSRPYYLPPPGQFDIHEYKIMEDFFLAFEDRHTAEHLLRLIKGSGAFRRFKDAIYSKALEEDWYQFEWSLKGSRLSG